MNDDANSHEEGSGGKLVANMKLFQIYEDDLAEIEKSLPILSESLDTLNDRRLKTHMRRLKRIVSDVRWNYGPHDHVERIDDQ